LSRRETLATSIGQFTERAVVEFRCLLEV